MKLKIDHDENGQAYVNDSAINELVAPYVQKINELEQTLINSQANAQMRDEGQKQLNAIIGEKEGYREAELKLQKARGWLNDVIVKAQQEAGVSGVVTPAQALDTLAGTSIEEEFKKQFPEVGMEDALFGYESQMQLRRALDNVSELAQALEEEQQATSLGSALESGMLTTDAILNANDDQIDAMIRKFEKE